MKTKEIQKQLIQGCNDSATLFDFCIKSEGMQELIIDIQKGVKKRRIKWLKNKR
jgi:hypothetical protein